MPKVKIIREPKPRALRKNEVLEVGKTYEMEEADANRWVRRGVAESIEDKKAEAKAAAAEEKKAEAAEKAHTTKH